MTQLFNPHQYYLNPNSIAPFIVAVLCVVLGLVVLSISRREAFNISFFYFCLAAGLWLLSSTLMMNSRRMDHALCWARLLFVGMMLVPAAMYALSSALTKSVKQQKKIIFFVYAESFLLASLCFHHYFIEGIHRTMYGIYPQAGLLFPVLIFFIMVTYALGFMNLIHYYFFRAQPKERKQLRIFLILFMMLQLAFVDLYASYDALIFPSGFVVIFGFILMMAIAKLKSYFDFADECAAMYEQRIKEKEKKIQEVSDRLKLAEEKLLESGKLTSMANLSAGILHQIAQPITAINGFIKFIKKEMDAENVFYRPVCLIDEQCVYLKQMLDDMMNLVKHREVKREPMNVHNAVYKAMNLLKDELRIRRINWDLDLQEGIPPVFADNIQLQQVFVNIVVNAMQALSALPREKEKYIHISSQFIRESDEVMISFRDTGPGIPQGEEEHIFEPFYSTRIKGVGMGLALCQTILQEQGGKISVERVAQSGANFMIRLPCLAPDQHVQN